MIRVYYIRGMLMAMKVIVAYPPLESSKGIPLLGQNRQFQWAKTAWTAYPMVSAYAATMLKRVGYQVFWLDGISQGWGYKRWLSEVKKIGPDLIFLESKTPAVKKHWQIINELKKRLKTMVVLAGDHVTALPKESLQKSRVDYVLTGGDYDFLLLNLVNYLTRKEKLEPGIWYRQGRRIKTTGFFRLNHDLDKLPFIDRDLTQWQLYAYKNSNYGQIPGTYTMFGRDCWWGKCSFCSWTTLFPSNCYRIMSVKRALDEVGYLLENYPVKEIMDDSGTFPTGKWLRGFCQGMIRRGYHKKIKISANMRLNSGLTEKDYQLMARAGFRFLLYGLESANQETLDKLNKNLKVEQIEPALRLAKRAGLSPHITIMFGYPWEDKKAVFKTLAFTRGLIARGLVDSWQATVAIPYPGTSLFKEAQKKKWLKTLDWDAYDMKEPILKTALLDEEIMALVRKSYAFVWTPQFLVRKLREGLTSRVKFKAYLWFVLKYISRLLDFKGKRKNGSFGS